MKLTDTYLKALPALLIAAVTGCASMGRPEGGPRDVTPPKFVNSSPRMSQTSVRPSKITLTFDENVELQDAFNKVIVSPVQLQAPQFIANGRTVTVDFRDTLIPDRTYTIDFGDAIKDLNEGNVLDGFSFDFATGPTIDSLRISGMVLEARTLEPAQGILVGVHTNPSDTALSKIPFERVTRTNALGQFTIRNLKPGNYRVFALDDVNHDYKWDPSENVAFYDGPVSPYVTDITVTDTLLSSDGHDSLSVHGGIKYLPNDILLTWFNENRRPQYLKNTARPEARRLVVSINAPADTLPSLVNLADGRAADLWSVAEISPARDSINYWITDTNMIKADSLYLQLKYQKPDSLDILHWKTDSIYFNFRRPKQKDKKAEAKEKTDTLKEFLAFNPTISNSIDLNVPLVFRSPTPLARIDSKAVKLEVERDSFWYPVPEAVFIPDSLNPARDRVMNVKWTPGAKYRLTIDSLGVEDIYGLANKKIEHSFTAKNLEDYSNLDLIISYGDINNQGLDVPIIVELLGTDDSPVASAEVTDGKAKFRYLNPGTYYARLFFDNDSNGVYTTGDIASGRQPEFTFYYPKSLVLKKNWDVEQTWIVDEIPLDAQKPLKIKKNKPKDKKLLNTPEEDEEQEEELPFGVNPFDDRRNDRKNHRDGLQNYGTGGFGSFGNGRRR